MVVRVEPRTADVQDLATRRYYRALTAAKHPPRTEAAICGRLLVGQGDDTYDPTCVLPAGHGAVCKPEALPRTDAPNTNEETR